MKLFSWGANSHGQLGQGVTSEACCEPREISIPGLEPVLVSSIVGGGGHTLVLDHLGRLYSSGWNSKGQLGHAEEEVLTFQLVESLLDHKIKHISCGWDSSLAVTSDGNLLVWGSNTYSQLASPKQKFSWTKSPKTVSISRVRQASLGLRHIVVVSEDGKVLVAGSGSKGQLGIVDSEGRPFPEVHSLTEVPGLGNILSVSCGQHHTLALSGCGRIYVWGSNKYGQLGLDSTLLPVVFVPQQLPMPAHGVKGRPLTICSGWTHSAVLTDFGEIFNWGRNSYGQLGDQRSVTWHPCKLNRSDRIQQIAVGSEHNLILTDENQILSWGWNEHGNCGTGTQENVFFPTVIPKLEIGKATLIGSGACHSFMVLDCDPTDLVH